MLVVNIKIEKPLKHQRRLGLHQYMYKFSRLNHHNTNSPGMTAIRFDDGLATTGHRCHIHVPQTFNMRCVILFHPSITNCCTCKLTYIGMAPSPDHPTDDTSANMLN